MLCIPFNSKWDLVDDQQQQLIKRKLPEWKQSPAQPRQLFHASAELHFRQLQICDPFLQPAAGGPVAAATVPLPLKPLPVVCSSRTCMSGRQELKHIMNMFDKASSVIFRVMLFSTSLNIVWGLGSQLNLLDSAQGLVSFTS
eukprot:1154781-Pelagomonas_calceolata.AAC.2